MNLKKIANKGLDLAQFGRRDEQELNDFFDSIKGIENKEVTLKDCEDGSVYEMCLKDLPYMGNKSARLAQIEGK